MFAKKIVKGVTLIELFVVISVLAILLVLGIPSLQNSIRLNRVIAQANEISSLVSFARTEAAQGAAAITLALSSEIDGWSAEVASDACVPPCMLRQASGRATKLTLPLPDDETTAVLTFNNRGILQGGSFSLGLESVPCTNARHSRSVEILASGNVRTTDQECGG